MEIDAYLKNLPEFAEPIVKVAQRFIRDSGVVTGKDYFRLGNDTRIAPRYYAMTIWVGRPEEELASQLGVIGLKAPEVYQQIYRNFSGLSIHDLKIFGTLVYPGLQPLDIVSANRYWRNPYESGRELFHFGGRHHTVDSNAGYFIRDQNIEVQTQDGAVLRRYENLKDFFESEIEVVSSRSFQI